MTREVVEACGVPDQAGFSREERGRGGVMDDLTAGNYNASGLAEPKVWTPLRFVSYPS